MSDFLRKHLFIEFAYAYHKDGLIAECYGDGRHLREAYGLSDGVARLSAKIGERYIIATSAGHGYFRLTTDDVPFIKSVEVYIVNSPDSDGSYTPSMSNFVSGVFNPLCLKINRGIEKWDELFPLICHELTHAEEDAGLSRRGASITDKALRTGYKKKTGVDNLDRHSLGVLMQNIFYKLTDFERNAYMAQFKATLMSTKERFVSVDDVYRWLKRQDIYKSYRKLMRDIDMLVRVDNVALKSGLVEFSKLFSDYDFKDFASFKRWLLRKKKQIRRKFNTNIPKIVAEYVRIVRDSNDYWVRGRSLEEDVSVTEAIEYFKSVLNEMKKSNIR